MLKYKAQNLQQEKNDAKNSNKCICLLSFLKEITKIDLKQYNLILSNINELEISKDGNYFAIINNKKQTVYIFSILKQQLIKNLSVVQYNQRREKSHIMMKFSVTNEYLIIKNYQAFYLVNLQRIDQTQRIVMQNHEYQIAGTDQHNQLFLSHFSNGMNTSIYSLQTKEELKKVFTPECGSNLIPLSNTILFKKIFKWNCVMQINSWKVISLRSGFYKKDGIFCFTGSKDIKIQNQFNGKLIQKIGLQNDLTNKVENAYFFQNDLLLQVCGEQWHWDKKKRNRRYYEIHCFKFKLHEYDPNNFKQINEKMGAKLVGDDVIEFLHYK